MSRIVERVRRAIAATAMIGAIGCGGSAPAPPPAATSIDPATTGSVRGRVTLAGTPPAATLLRLDGDRACAALVPQGVHSTESYVVGADGGLGNVFVYVAQGLEGRSFPVPREPVVVDQQQCWYTPRVVGVRVGQPLQVLNSDPLLHNVRSNSEINEPIHQGQPVQGMRYTHTFSVAEVMVPLKCDVHAWMDAWVGVVNHPYFAVTAADGAFALSGLPAGTYTIEAWHEAAGRQTGTVTVTAGGEATLSLRLEVPAA